MKLFDKVKCKGFYSKVHDGTFIYLDTQNLKASHMNSNATDTECLVEDDVDRAEKTYYKHVKQNFCGVIVGFTDLIVTGRGGCWFCPNMRYTQLKHLRTHHRDLWDKLLELENEPDLIGNMWNTLTKTRIHDWEERFYWEDRQMDIFDYLREED